jgi:hypothetical protein
LLLRLLLLRQVWVHVSSELREVVVAFRGTEQVGVNTRLTGGATAQLHSRLCLCATG